MIRPLPDPAIRPFLDRLAELVAEQVWAEIVEGRPETKRRRGESASGVASMNQKQFTQPKPIVQLGGTEG